MRLSSMMLKRLSLAGNNFTAIAGLIFLDYFNKLLINDKCGNIDSIKLLFTSFNATFLLYERILLLITNERKYYRSSIIFLVNKQIFLYL